MNWIRICPLVVVLAGFPPAYAQTNVPLAITKMVADLQRPYIYAVQPPPMPGQMGQVFFINTETEQIDRVLPIVSDPRDLTIHYGEGRLYVVDWLTTFLRVVDLQTQTQLPSIPVLYGGLDRVNIGPPGRLIMETWDQNVDIFYVATTNLNTNVTQVAHVREGDGETSLDGRFYYRCDNNSSVASIYKYAVGTNALTLIGGGNAHPNGSRSLLLSPDGTRLFWRGFMYETALSGAETNFMYELANLGAEIYATTFRGELAFASDHVIDTRNGQTIYTLPVSSTVIAVAGNQQKVFLLDAAQQRLRVIPMSAIASVPGTGLLPTPADGSVASPLLDRLNWSGNLFATGYRAFFGTNAAVVAAATTNSAAYLGATASNSIPLAGPLQNGATYYWRVDSVGLPGSATGSVWSFTVSAVTVSPPVVSVRWVAGVPPPPQVVRVTGPPAVPWTAAVESLGISVAPVSGSTTGAITVTFDMAALPAGRYTNAILITAGGLTLRVPISTTLLNLSAAKMIADPKRPYIYVLDPGGIEEAFVLFLNTETGNVDRMVPIGSQPTDMTINRFEDRLYVSNWQRNNTSILDLTTGTLLPPLQLGADVYKINASRAGRIVVEQKDQFVYARLIDTANGAALAMAFLREGDGEFDPTGRYYYHCDNNISDRELTKYDLNNSTFVRVSGNGGRSGYGSRNLVMSLNGERLFWTKSVFDPDVVELGYLNTEIYACNTNGAIAFSDSGAYDSTTQQLIYNLPFTSTVMAVDSLDQRLWYFQPGTAQPLSVPMTVIRSPSITRHPMPAAVFIGGSTNLSVQAMGLGPLSYQWRFNGANLINETNLLLALANAQLDREGDYQVVVSNAYGAVTSLVAHVTMLIPPVITQQPAGVVVSAGSTATLRVQAAGPGPLLYQWSFEGGSIGGATNAMLVLNNAQAVHEGVYRVSVSNVAGGVVSDLALVRVLPSRPSIFSHPASLTVAAGSDATFSVGVSGTMPVTYQWWFNNGALPGATGAALSLTNVQAGQAGAYQVVVANTLGSATSAVATLTVTSSIPRFITQPSSFTGPAGSNVILNALARGTDPISYQWLMNGTNLADAQTQTLLLSNSTVVQSGNYALVALNIQGAATSSVALVTITGSPPAFVQQPTGATLSAGGTFSLNALANGSAPLAYQWHFQGGPIAGRTNSSITYSNVTSAEAGAYFVVASNAYGVRTSATANVVVTFPPVLLSGLTNRTVELGTDLLLSVTAQGASNLIYSWQFHGLTVPGATSRSLLVTNVRLFYSGAYRVTVANAFGSVSSSMILAVQPPAGNVLGWGDNSGGQTNVPVDVSGVVAVTGGDFHSVALQRDGRLVGWGSDGGGLASPPAGLSNVISVAAGAAHTLALKLDGSVAAWGWNDLGQTNVPVTATSVVAVAAGDAHSLALRQDGSMVAWGDNTYGQSTLPPSPGFIIAIAAGRNHALALRNSGTVVAWGLNSAGQTQVPSNLNIVNSLAAGYLHSVALRANGTVAAWGDNSYGQTAVPTNLANVVAIAAGDFHTLALRADGTIVGWGDNTFGQLNSPPFRGRAFAIGAGYYHSLAVVPPILRFGSSAAAVVLSWDGRYVLQQAPAVIGPFSDVTSISPVTNQIASPTSRFFRLREVR